MNIIKKSLVGTIATVALSAQAAPVFNIFELSVQPEKIQRRGKAQKPFCRLYKRRSALMPDDNGLECFVGHQCPTCKLKLGEDYGSKSEKSAGRLANQ